MLTPKMSMVPTRQGRTVTDIELKAEHFGNLSLEIKLVHALTGCDQIQWHLESQNA